MATMGKGLLPTSGRIRQRQVGKGEGAGHVQGMGKGVVAVAPGVLRYRVRDGGGVPAVGEVHTASAASSAVVRRHWNRGRQVSGAAVSGRVLCVETPEAEIGETCGDSAGAGGAAVATTVTVLVEAAAEAAAVPSLPQYRALAPVIIRAGTESDSTVIGTLQKGDVVIALSVKSVSGAKQLQIAAGWVSVAGKDGNPHLELVRTGAARNASTGWKPRPPPTENQRRRMTPRRMREGQEADCAPPPQRPVDISGWEPRDGSAKPIIDAYLAYAPTKGRTAMAEVKIMEKKEQALRVQTGRKMDRLSRDIGRILNDWDTLVASASEQTHADARLLAEALETNNGVRNATVDDLDEWHKARQDDLIEDSRRNRIVHGTDSDGGQPSEHPQLDEAKVVAEEATDEVVREQNRVRKLHEMMTDLAEQLMAIKASVRELNSEMKALQTNGVEALHHFQELVKGLKNGIEVTDREIKKAVEHLREYEHDIRTIKEQLAQLAESRKEREEGHQAEMGRLRKLLERMKQKHVKDLETMEQLHLDRLAQMRRDVQELIDNGARMPELDMDALAQEVQLLIADKGFDVTKADLRKHLQESRNKHAKLESDFMIHSAEEQDLIAQRDTALANLPKAGAKTKEEDPLRALWRTHKGAFRDWQRSCRRAEKRPVIGTQTMEILKAPGRKILQPLEYMTGPERPAIRQPEPDAEMDPEPLLESKADPRPHPKEKDEDEDEEDEDEEATEEAAVAAAAEKTELVPELEPEPEQPRIMPGPEAKPRAIVRVKKTQLKPTELQKPKTPKKFVRKKIEKEKTQKYQAPPKPERVLQAPKTLGFAISDDVEHDETQSERPETLKKSGETIQLRGPQKRILTSGHAKSKTKTSNLKVKVDPTKATMASVGFGGIESSVSEEPGHEKQKEPDWERAWKIIWTSMQINRTPHNFSYIDVDEAFEVEDAKNDGMIGKKSLGRGLRRLQIKLQTAELSSVHSAISPSSPTLDYESFARELYMRVKAATGVEREQTELEFKERVRKHPEETKKENIPWQKRVWKPLRSALLSQRDIGDLSLADIHAAFHSNDTGKDGHLSISEVARALNQLNIALTDAQLQVLFDAADTSMSGNVSYPELVAEIHTHIQEIVEQDPLAQQKKRKKKEAEEFRRRAAAKKVFEQQHGLMAELTEQNRQEEKSIKRIQRFLRQTEANMSLLSDDVAKRGGADAVLGRNGSQNESGRLDNKLESLRVARDEAEKMLADLVKTHERTKAHVATIQEKTKAAQKALGIDAGPGDAVALNKTSQFAVAEPHAEDDRQAATKVNRKSKQARTQKKRASELKVEEAMRQVEIAAATEALFGVAVADSSGQATVQALIEVLESDQQGEWTKFKDFFAEKLREAAPAPVVEKVDTGVRAVVTQAADRETQSQAPAAVDTDSFTDSGSSPQLPVKVDRATFMQMISAPRAGALAQVKGNCSNQTGIDDEMLLTSPSDGILDATPTKIPCKPSPLTRSPSWPGASALPSERELPPNQFSHLESGEEDETSNVLGGTIANAPKDKPVTSNPKLRKFKLTVSVNDPGTDGSTEIEVQATDIDDLHRKVKKELKLDQNLDIRLSAEGLPGHSSPRAIRSLSQLPSPARIQVWKRDEVQFDHSGMFDLSEEEDGAPIEESQSMPLLDTAIAGNEATTSDSDDDVDDSDDMSDGDLDLSDLRAAFSAVESASSKQRAKVQAAERMAEATVQETISSLDSAESTQQVSASAAKHRSAVFTDPSAPLPIAGAAALERALRPVTAPHHGVSEFVQQNSSGKLSWQRELTRRQDEQLTAVAEALRTPSTTIQGLTMCTSAFPSKWSGVEVAPTRNRGYVPIRPWGGSTPRNQAPARLASLGTENAGPPVVVHSATHNGYVLGMSKLGKPGRGLRLRPSTSNAGGLDGLSSSRSTLPAVWSSGSLATLVPSLPAEPVFREVMPHAVFLSAEPMTARAGTALRPVGSAASNYRHYQNMPNSAPTRGSKANFRVSLRTPLQQVVL